MTPEASPQPSWEMRAAFATSAAPIPVASAATAPAPGTGASVARSSRRASRDSDMARPRGDNCCERRLEVGDERLAELDVGLGTRDDVVERAPGGRQLLCGL